MILPIIKLLMSNLSICSNYAILASIVLLVYYTPFLVFNELFLGNKVDCILSGIRNETEAKSDEYRELVRNTCGMYGVPPNHFPFNLNHTEAFFMRVFSKNKTFINTSDYFQIKQDEELERKYFVLAFWFLFFLQIFVVVKVIFYFYLFIYSLTPKLIND